MCRLSLHAITRIIERNPRCYKIANLLERFQRKKYLAKFGASAIIIQQATRRYLKRASEKKLGSAAVALQSHFRAWHCRFKYIKIIQATICIQKTARMKIAQNLFQNALKLHYIQVANATKIQTLFRKMRHRRYFQRIRRCALRIQYCYGSYRLSKRLHGAALSLQKYIRGYNARKTYKCVRACAIRIQCFVRYCQANVRRHELLESLKLKGSRVHVQFKASFVCTIVQIDMLFKKQRQSKFKAC